MNIQWYPGHMAKTKRLILEHLRQVDLVCELVDARIPISSRNPDLDQMIGDKPRLLIFNRMDQADPAWNRMWLREMEQRGIPAMECDSKSGAGIGRFLTAAREILKEKLARYAAQGQIGRPIRAMIVGIPNVGKSSFINRAAKGKRAAAQDRPGVTRGKQWVTVDPGLYLLDTPGVLWPKLNHARTGLHLAFTGAVRDEIMDLEALAAHLMETLWGKYPQALKTRYKIEDADGEGHALLALAARKRGFLLPGGVLDTERMAKILLDEFRGGKLGRFTLETPEDMEEELDADGGSGALAD